MVKKSYSKIYTDKLKSDLVKVTNLIARDFLLKNGYSSSSFKMPDYYQPSNLDKITMQPINWRGESPSITKTLDILTPKSYLSWRSFNFLNPYIFLHIVNEITKENNWKLIKKILCSETLINSYSTPVLYLQKYQTSNGKAIENWIQMAEKDLIKDCIDYNYLIVTDIKNFYPRIYTHSISWAIHGKNNIKKPKNRYNYKLLGNKLDKLFQNSRDGQTNGIPVGSMASDLIAEIILIDIDKKLSKSISSEKLENSVLVLRYRDDYRILSKTLEQGKRVLHNLSKILNAEYDLSLNSDKTRDCSDIIEGAFRPWSLEIKKSNLLRRIHYGDLSDCKNISFLKDSLIETYKIQKQFFDGRASISILSKLVEGLNKKEFKIKLNHKEIPEIISILRKLTLLREEATPQVFLLLDLLLEQIKNKKAKERVLEEIESVIRGKSDQDFQSIWFYRLCLSHSPKKCVTILDQNPSSPLLRVVSKNFYKNDFDIFNEADIPSADKKELEKFVLINRKKLKKANGKKIDPKSINVFKY